MIEVCGIHKSFKSKHVLKGITFGVSCGDITGCLGPNGAGKTTTIKAVCGINKVDRGYVNTNGNSVAVIFDYNGLYPNMSAYENLLFFLKMSDSGLSTDDCKKRVTEILKLIDLESVYSKKVKTFSKGMSRRMALGRAIIFSPNILILDEPFDGLDVRNCRFMVGFFKNWVSEKSDRCILFSSHNMSEAAEFCNKIIIINGGTIIEKGTVTELLNRNIIGYKVRTINSDNTVKAARVLEKFGSVEIRETELNVLVSTDVSDAIVRELVKSEIAFCEAYIVRRTLEDIYLEAIKNESNA